MPGRVDLCPPQIGVTLVRFKLMHRIDQASGVRPVNFVPESWIRQAQFAESGGRVINFDSLVWQFRPGTVGRSYGGKSLPIRRPGYRPEVRFLAAVKNFSGIASICRHEPNFFVIPPPCQKRNSRSIRRNSCAGSFIGKLSRRSAQYRDFPKAGRTRSRMPRTRRISLKPKPGNDEVSTIGKPTLREWLEAFRQRYSVGFSSVHLPHVEAAGVGECQVLAVGRDRAAGQGSVVGIGRQPALAEDTLPFRFLPKGDMTDPRAQSSAGQAAVFIEQ